MTTFDTSCLGACHPVQILNIEMAINDPSDVKIYDKCDNTYDLSQLLYSYSTDGACWSCWMSNEDVVHNTLDEISDFFVRIKVPGEIKEVEVNGEKTSDYTTSLDSSFQLNSYCNSNNYNPYANIDGALQLQQSLSNQVACTVGIPIYYFKANGKAGSADITFKEYALKEIESVKQIKLIVNDGQMPSSKPEFAELGLDWQTDWQTEISKSMFATAFGLTAQPMEGDLIYVPLQKRMWMVSEAYDEKNGSLMWQSTTWQVFLTKYQADASMDLNIHEDFVDTLVKNKYDDLFGESEPLDSGVESTDLTRSRPANMYSVFKSDSTRKEMTCDSIDFQETSLYHRNTLVMDNCYKFNENIGKSCITYQRQYCGDAFSLSFIIRVLPNVLFDGDILTIGHHNVSISQCGQDAEITFSALPGKSIKINAGEWYFITLRSSKQLRTIDMSASLYTYPDNIPLYKLTNYHYYFDIDNAQQIVGKWNEELLMNGKEQVSVWGFNGNMSNIKLFDIYDNDIAEMLQQYPTNANLLINDTARPLYGLLGVTKA